MLPGSSRTRTRTRIGSLAIALAAALGHSASAELRAQVGRSTAGLYAPVRITVQDPLGGLDVNPGPITATMADGYDRRRSVTLDPTGRPGEWSGWFTPVSLGRYTGTAVLERGDQKEIGLVPLVRVIPSRLPGFVGLHATSRRAFQYSNGDTLFPIGVRMNAEDVRAVSSWPAELAKLRSFGINYLELPVEWPAGQSDAERRAALERIDRLLFDVDRAGRPRVQLRLLGPQPMTDASASAYEGQVRRWVRRWGYSPAIAAWLLDGARADTAPERCARFVQAVRSGEAYRHLIGVPGKAGQPAGGAEFTVAPVDWQNPSNQFSLLEFPDDDSATPLPGESTWQMLAVGGIGLPLWPYHPGQPRRATLERVAMLVDVAASIPFHLRSTQVNGLVPIDSPGSFSRLGPQWIGWVGTEGGKPLTIPLGAGRFRARFWDPGNDLYLRDTFLSSGSRTAQLDLPPNLKAVFVQVQPLGFRYGMGHGTGVRRAGTVALARATPPVRAPAPPKSDARAARAAAWATRQQLHRQHVQLALAHRRTEARRRAEAHQRAYEAYLARKLKKRRAHAAHAAHPPRKTGGAKSPHARRAEKAHRWAQERAWQKHLRRLVLKEQAELRHKKARRRRR